MTAPKKKSLLQLLRKENDFILDLLTTCNVPESVEVDYSSYLLDNASKKTKTFTDSGNAASANELQDRLNIIKNKMKSKKRPMSERAQKKRENKKLKKNKQFKKVLISATKAMKNENSKLTDVLEDKKDIKKLGVPKKVYNEDGKIVFSKFDFAPHQGAKIKKSHTNPKMALQKIKKNDKLVNELKEQGDLKKASELKNEIAWKNAFDKIEGKKVKDDKKLLIKTLKKRKVEKKKSKKQWTQRKETVESGIEQRQKKRQENINKRIKDKGHKKLKRLSKKGRVIPGF